MEFIAIPTEQTTALTDALLGLEAIFLAGYVQRFVRSFRLRARIWQSLLLFTALASLIGAAAHGLAISRATYELLWKPLLLTLGLVVANLVLAALLDLWGPRAVRRGWPWLTVVAVGFFGLTQIEGVSFFFFILYEAIGMLAALVCYCRLALRGRLPGAGVVVMGIILQLAAAATQAAGPFEFKAIWVFDHNGLFHIIGMMATLVMVWGAGRGFAPTDRRN